ncbi:hypothetical protein F2Q70_00004854 [Brassica cretica]|uniref:Uncharacterized protein n=1 Tax=Brassica cretica TaxID=69181 RepID=A0A8S9FRA3_BRACR|nr:hypothetical protein F2Q68_00021630 [Brassica cretica]KAF2573619.1 hypothetical protein F2Q70_00004854 [Brassica cretica]
MLNQCDLKPLGGEESKRERHEQTPTRRLVTKRRVSRHFRTTIAGRRNQIIKVTMNPRKANQEEEVGETGFLLVCIAAQKEESITYGKQKIVQAHICMTSQKATSLLDDFPSWRGCLP